MVDYTNYASPFYLCIIHNCTQTDFGRLRFRLRAIKQITAAATSSSSAESAISAILLSNKMLSCDTNVGQQLFANKFCPTIVGQHLLACVCGFTKRLPGLSNASYSDRLSILGLRSLQLRRLHQDLIYTYKIIFGLVDLDCPNFFLVSPNETTRGHVSKLFVRQSRVDVRKYFFGNRVVKIWHSLPATVEDCKYMKV